MSDAEPGSNGRYGIGAGFNTETFLRSGGVSQERFKPEVPLELMNAPMDEKMNHVLEMTSIAAKQNEVIIQTQTSMKAVSLEQHMDIKLLKEQVLPWANFREKWLTKKKLARNVLATVGGLAAAEIIAGIVKHYLKL
jgi:hypothetical protein